MFIDSVKTYFKYKSFMVLIVDSVNNPNEHSFII